MRKGILSVAAVIAVGGMTLAMAASFPDPPKASAPAQGTASIVLAGGCFWGMQGVYEHMKGVTNTVVGYAGGKKDTAHYDIGLKTATPITPSRSRSPTILQRSVMASC